MADGSEASREDSHAPAGLSDFLLCDSGPECRIGALQLDKGDAVVSCQVIGIAPAEVSFLVAVPHAAWHRVGARRYLPADPPPPAERASLAPVLRCLRTPELKRR